MNHPRCLVLAGAVVFAAATVVRVDEWQPLGCVRVALLGGTLTAAAVSDLRSRRIPNRIVVPASGLLLALQRPGQPGGRLVTAVIVVAALFVLSLAQPAALGMGDSKLALAVLCGLGGATTDALVVSLALAGLASVALLLRGGRPALRLGLPLAPFLLLGTLLSILVYP